ncbi:MAG: flagellar hook-associated protein FlgL [Oligoflexia bacterium]|nr:flagellar hook-associated protein FlgL [Oligoflexia bacterium]
MRVSNNMGYDQVKGNISKNRTEMVDLQNQAATQKRIMKPSDDPVGTSRVLELRTTQAGTEQYLKNMNIARAFLNTTDLALGEVTDSLIRAKELALSQSSDASANASSRLAVATEVDQLFNTVVNIGNRRFGERYIFGGFKTTNAPFDKDGNFLGDDGSMRVEIAKGVFATMNLSGDKVFSGSDSRIGLIPEDRRGSTKPNYPEIPSSREDGYVDPIEEVRGPTSQEKTSETGSIRDPQSLKGGEAGENIFKVMNALSAGLRANDTVAIQETLERLDAAIDQVVILRSQIGSRVNTLENTHESLAKQKVEDSTLLSSIEDADAFEVFTDITKNENILKATLQTSGKLIQPSLLDFLR